jgi:two-component system cell cycle sensor histidine kinase/response regulator CckA
VSDQPLQGQSRRIFPGKGTREAVLLLGSAAVISAVAILLQDQTIRLSLAVSAITLVALLILLQLRARFAGTRIDPKLVALFPFLEGDSAPSIVVDPDQQVLWANGAAKAQFPALADVGIVASVESVMPDASGLLRRLRRGLERGSMSIEDVAVRQGHARFALRSYASGQMLFRMEALATRGGNGGGSGSVPVLTVSQTGTVLSMNDALRRMIGIRARDLTAVFVTPPTDTASTAEIITPDGHVTVYLQQTSLSAGRREIAMIPIENLSSVHDLKTGLEELPVAVLKLGVDGQLLQANASARSLLSIDHIDPDMNFANLVTGLGRSVRSWLEDALHAHHPLQPEVLRVRDRTEESFLQVSLMRSQSAEGPVLTAVLHDATELKTLEAQFVQSQKMQAIGQLAGGVAHDFNNLLTAISGHCDLLLLRHDQGDPEYGDLVQINQNANRAASLVGQLLAFSRKQTLQPELIDLRDTLSDLTHLLNRLVGERVSLTLMTDPDLSPMRADRRQLEQVLMNLVVNARDAMPEGGEITIEAKSVVLDNPITRARVTLPAGDYACVTVTDQGIGIPQDKITKIFEPFYTTKRTGEGTGLGLSTAYGIVKQSGGFIFAESVVGKGTAFEIFFPAYHGQTVIPTESTAAPPERPAATGDGVVLLVEDEAPVRAFAARALRLNGFTVLEAENAEAALELLENPALEVDLFVTDVIMPGLDGPSWVRQALALRPGIPVVFVSGYAEDLLSGEEDPIPNSVFLPKPFSLKQLIATVQTQSAMRDGVLSVKDAS